MTQHSPEKLPITCLRTFSKYFSKEPERSVDQIKAPSVFYILNHLSHRGRFLDCLKACTRLIHNTHTSLSMYCMDNKYVCSYQPASSKQGIIQKTAKYSSLLRVHTIQSKANPSKKPSKKQKNTKTISRTHISVFSRNIWY